jgi:hypothetical protein
MKKLIFVFLTLLTFNISNAQFIKEKAINVSLGIGYAFPFEDSDVMGSGFYASGEYILKVASWVDFKPYAGLVLTKSRLIEDYNPEDDLNLNPNELKKSDLRSTTNALLLGGKIRVKAPIPYFAPYFEIGIGTSIGSFETITYGNNINKNGPILHIPFSIGVELGRKHNFDIVFLYYVQPSVKQMSGAAEIGYKIPIKS